MKVKNLTNLRPHKGFALIVTITLMALMLVIAIGMLTLSTIEVRISNQAADQAIANANARMALILAIGELQKYAGPDQRVTAEAAILEDPDDTTTLANRHWMGVWRTDGLKDEDAATAQTIIHRNPATTGHQAGSLQDRRADGSYDANEQTLQWLVSQSNQSLTSDPAIALPENQRITLVGNKSVDQVSEQVHAGKISLKKESMPTGSLAWWIGDESTKARFDLASPENPSPVATTIPAQNGPSIVPTFSDYEQLSDQTFPKIITRSSGELSGMADQASIHQAFREHFHDFSFSSRSLLTDTQNGGLRKDLTAFINKGNVLPLSSAHQGLTADTPILSSPKMEHISPKFGMLAKWAALAQTNTGSGIDPIAPKGIAGGFTWGWNQNVNFDNNAIDLTKQDTPPIYPTMLDAGISYGASLEKIGPSVDGKGTYRLNVHYFPRFVLWNPYNVKLKAAKYAVNINMPSRFDVSIRLPGQTINRQLFNASHAQYDGENMPQRPSFSIPSTSFEPGEALLFTADAGSSLNRYWGDVNTSLANDLGNFPLSCGKSAPLQDNFYFKAEQSFEIADDKIRDAAYQITAVKHGNGTTSYKHYIYQLYLHEGSNNSASDVTRDLSNFKPLQMIIQTEDGSSGTDAPWFVDIPASASTRLSKLGETPVIPYYRFKWGHRMQWLSDTIENQTIKPGYYGSPYLEYNTIANHNMRASMHMRSPVEVSFRASASAGRYTHGISIDDPYGWDWLDPSLLPVPVSGKNRVSPFGRPAEFNGQTFPMLDVPSQRTPLTSIGALQHLPLSVFPWHPTYAIGNGLADPRVERNATTNYFSPDEWQRVGTHNNKEWSRVRQAHVNPSLANDSYLYDLSYEANFALWDTYFLSSIPKGTTYQAGDPLPNPRLTLAGDSGTPITSELNDFYHAARHFSVKGGFNINSTSETAWAALLSSFRGDPAMEITLNDGSKINADDVYSRLVNPINQKYTNGDENDESMWKGYRQLSDDEIRSLAKEIVKEVKRRGPFLSLADFVNRRLVDPPQQSGDETELTRTGLTGTLQAAIDRTSINSLHLSKHKIDKSKEYSGFKNPGPPNSNYPLVARTPGGRGLPPDHNHWAESKLVGAPSYLTQADLLQKFAPVISARGDTFVIRAYGEALASDGKVLARSWCEAKVQRIPEAFGPDDTGLDPDTDINAKPLASFGRKIKIVSFRWLNPNEI